MEKKYTTQVILLNIEVFERRVARHIENNHYDFWEGFWKEIGMFGNDAVGTENVRVLTLSDFMEYLNDKFSVQNDWATYIQMREYDPNEVQ
jgi:hypothetical protein